MNTPLGIIGSLDNLVLSLLVFGFSLIIKRDVAFRLLALMCLLSLVSFLARLGALLPLVRTLDMVIASMPIVLAVISRMTCAAPCWPSASARQPLLHKMPTARSTKSCEPLPTWPVAGSGH